MPMTTELDRPIEEGGFVPTVDRTASPDVSWNNFRYGMNIKQTRMAGDFRSLQ